MIEKLQELGLTYYESKALEALFKDSLTAKELSKKAGIPLGKVYSIIKSLERKRLIKMTHVRPQKIYVESASEVLNMLIESKQKEHEDLLSNLREFALKMDTLKSRQSKFLEIGTSREETREIQSRTFNESTKEVCQIFNMFHNPESNRIIKTIWEKEIVKAVERGVVFRCIYPKNVMLPKILANLNKERPDMFQVKRLDNNFTRCDIIDRKKILMKIVGKDDVTLGGTLFIENEKLAKNLHQIFEEFWKEAEYEKNN